MYDGTQTLDTKQVRDRPSVTIELTRANKLDRYSPLLLIAQKQANDKKRELTHPSFRPSLSPPLVSMAPGVTTTREWLATRYRRKWRTHVARDQMAEA